MSVVMTNDGLRWALWFVKVGLAELFVQLFSNDHQPAQGDLWQAYIPPTWPGYQPLQPRAWSNPYLNSSQQGVTDNPILTWTLEAALDPPQTVYGYALLNSSLQLIAAERTEPSGYVMFYAGQVYSLQLSFTESNPP